MLYVRMHVQSPVNIIHKSIRHQQQEQSSSGKPAAHHLPQQAVTNVIGVLLMLTLVFVTATLLLQRKTFGNGAPPTSLRYCRNGGQTFQLIPSSVAADGATADHSGRNGRIL